VDKGGQLIHKFPMVAFRPETKNTNWRTNMTNLINIENMMTVENCVVGNDTLLLCKETPHKWLITNSKGGVLFTSKTKKMAVLEIGKLRKIAVKEAAKPKGKKKTAPKKSTAKKAATVKTNKNVNKFRFGSKIDIDTVVEYAGEVWGDTLELSNVEFIDSHYWKGTVTNKEGSSVDNVRLDYLINFCRVPTSLKTPEVQAVQERVLATAT
jgi:hypothetical protein